MTPTSLELGGLQGGGEDRDTASQCLLLAKHSQELKGNVATKQSLEQRKAGKGLGADGPVTPTVLVATQPADPKAAPPHPLSWAVRNSIPSLSVVAVMRTPTGSHTD